jgi:hydrogenase nickel incorporation protein HypA/HybF
MHEMGVTQSILGIVLEHARKNEAKRVLAIRLQIGELTGYVGEIVNHMFQLLAEGTAAEGARLEVEMIATRLRCGDCGKEFEVAPMELNAGCPQCASTKTEFLRGREFLVESIEIE